MERKGNMGLGALLAAGITLVVTGIVLAFGQQVTSDIGADFTAGTYEKNSTLKAQQGTDNVAKKLPTVGLIVAAVVIIGLLLKGFASR